MPAELTASQVADALQECGFDTTIAEATVAGSQGDVAATAELVSEGNFRVRLSGAAHLDQQFRSRYAIVSAVHRALSDMRRRRPEGDR